MGFYLGVRAVESKGFRIALVSDKRPDIPMGYRLIGIMWNDEWRIAPDLTDEKEYVYFYDEFAAGLWVRMDLYLLKSELVPECPDEGRVSE